MKRQLLAASALLLIVAVPAAACARDVTGQISVDGQLRTYLVHLPAAWSAGKHLALVLNFHGGGGMASGVTRITHFNDVADRSDFIVAYPQGIAKHWNDGRVGGPGDRAGVDDVAFTAALIDKLVVDDKVDPKRVYATGLSNGAMFTERLGCQLSDRIAAIAPVAGQLPEALAPACYPPHPPAVLLIAGTADPLVPYGGGKAGLGGNVISIDATVAKWASLNRCERTSNGSLPNAGDSMPVVISTYAPCARGREVKLIKIENGGHTWPGGEQYLPPFLIGRTSQSFDASETIWEFFRRFTL